VDSGKYRLVILPVRCKRRKTAEGGIRACGRETAFWPFVATLVDVTGLVIYFTVASVMLRGTLL